MENNTPTENYIERVLDILRTARSQAARQVNLTMVRAYLEIGRIVVEQEQGGKTNASYGKQTIVRLSKRLTAEFGRGFSERNLEQMRRFYQVYSNPQTLSADLQPPDFQLSWSNYIRLTRMRNEAERRFYEIESITNHWSVRELDRQFDTALYTRIALSRDKDRVRALSKAGEIVNHPKSRFLQSAAPLLLDHRSEARKTDAPESWSNDDVRQPLRPRSKTGKRKPHDRAGAL